MSATPSRSISLLFVVLALGYLPARAQFSQKSYTFSPADCSQGASVCSGYSEAEFGYYKFLLDGKAYAKTFTPCMEVIKKAYPLSEIPDDGSKGPYQLVNWTVSGASYKGRFADPLGLLALMQDADPAGDWTLDLATKSIIGGIAETQYSALDILQEPTGITAKVASVSRTTGGTASFAFAAGNHVLEVMEGNVLKESVTVAVNCPPSTGGFYQSLALNVGTSKVVCVDLGKLTGPVVPGSVTLTPAPRTSTITLTNSDCFRVSAKSVGRDSVAIRYCDAANNCATTLLAVTTKLAKPIVSVTVRDSVSLPGEVKTFCLDTTELPGRIVSAVDICAATRPAFVEFTSIASTRCVKYRGLKEGGADSTCMVLCDDLGFCDTTKIVVTAATTPPPLPNQVLVFTIDKGTSARAMLNVEGFRSRPADLENLCALESGRMVFFSFDERELSVGFEGLEVGMERACVVAKASDGVTKLFDITVHVIDRTPARDTIRIVKGERQRWCFPDPELVGPAVRMFDDCKAATALVATATTDAVTCLDFTGLTAGSQKLCINVCDSTGRCDVTTLVIEVTETASPEVPQAVDDAADVPASGTVSVDVLANDFSATTITTVTVVTGPRNGTASFDANRKLVYVQSPMATSCANDSVRYQICNAAGCSQATVRLRVDCGSEPGGPNDPRGPIEIVRGLSPNFDGVNDRWVIGNIERYPDNEVKIYNRWGSRVYAAKGYDNTWEGNFQDGKPLPDGTYFYVVVIDGKRVIANYLELRR